jgi:hypothetical protein
VLRDAEGLEPLKLAKDPVKKDALGAILSHCAEALRTLTLLDSPCAGMTPERRNNREGAGMIQEEMTERAREIRKCARDHCARARGSDLW